MPVFSPAKFVDILVARDTNGSSTANATAGNSNPLQVVCAWPVSGQYGAGSRFLYYALVAACIFARRSEWLRNACLAAALLIPAVAAIHSFVLAAFHHDNAVDMDIYGAFQFCAIGILAAPVTVRLSRTYFYDPGRNTIFIWTALVLAGLLSLAVEFYRINTVDCTTDDSGNPISPDAGAFPYGTSCSLTCNPNDGPFSLTRGGSANNIYVIPAPHVITFGTATLLSAACCIPAVLSLITMWNKILEINWKARFGNRDEKDNLNDEIEGTNGATLRKMMSVNSTIKAFLSVVEVPVFGGAVLTILIFGEINFFSTQVNYMVEPIATVGQWSPIAGTFLGFIGSLYILLATVAEEEDEESHPSTHRCTCAHTHPFPDHDVIQTDGVARARAGTAGTVTFVEHPPYSPGSPRHDHHGSPPRDLHHTSTITSQATASLFGDAGSRRKVAKVLMSFGKFFGTAPRDFNNYNEFKEGKAGGFPEIPGETERNRNLSQIQRQWTTHPDRANGDELRGQSSRAGSIRSNISGLGISHGRAQSPAPRVGRPLSRRNSLEGQDHAQPIATDSAKDRPKPRRDTLEVPSVVHYSPDRNTLVAGPSTSRAPGEMSPTIMVSSEPEAFPSAPRSPRVKDQRWESRER